ncbi:MAG TPA: lytic murein transglycosylase, partial [Burkholderiaceae bacterium]
VPASVVAGIIGVETFYGRIMGNFSALDALATLSFAFPSGRSDRSPLFRKHLGELFVLARKEGVEPGSLKGSYAGAMGWGQFMPGSWNKYAVDFDGDGHIDLIGNPVDAIGSIANFLAEHGWQRGMPSDYTLKLPSETATRAALLVHDIEPKFSAAQLATRGVALSEAGQQHAGPLAVIELQRGAAAPMYFAGTQNFYVLTRYNQSAYYAMAVIELGRVLAAKRAMAAAEPAAAPRSNCAPADFREVLSLQALPLELRKLLDADQNTADGMAERGAQFNESDVIADNDQRPTRRFVLAALSSDCALVAFEQGGRGKTVRMASFRRGNGRWELGPQTLLRDTPQSVQDLLGQDPGRQGQAR